MFHENVEDIAAAIFSQVFFLCDTMKKVAVVAGVPATSRKGARVLRNLPATYEHPKGPRPLSTPIRICREELPHVRYHVFSHFVVLYFFGHACFFKEDGHILRLEEGRRSVTTDPMDSVTLQKDGPVHELVWSFTAHPQVTQPLEILPVPSPNFKIVGVPELLGASNITRTVVVSLFACVCSSYHTYINIYTRHSWTECAACP